MQCVPCGQTFEPDAHYGAAKIDGLTTCPACARASSLAETFECADCGQTKPKHLPDDHTYGTGVFTTARYARTADDRLICWECAAERTRADMIEGGRTYLYLTEDGKGGRTLTDWPGTLKFRAYGARTSWHNIGRTRIDVWFAGPDGYEWHAYQIGEWTQIAHCKRTKRPASAGALVRQIMLESDQHAAR